MYIYIYIYIYISYNDTLKIDFSKNVNKMQTTSENTIRCCPKTAKKNAPELSIKCVGESKILFLCV